MGKGLGEKKGRSRSYREGVDSAEQKETDGGGGGPEHKYGGHASG